LPGPKATAPSVCSSPILCGEGASRGCWLLALLLLALAWPSTAEPGNHDKKNRWQEPPPGLGPGPYHVPPDAEMIKRGDEIGRFNMGSTVILLFGENNMSWDKELVAGQNIIMGQSIASII